MLGLAIPASPHLHVASLPCSYETTARQTRWAPMKCSTTYPARARSRHSQVATLALAGLSLVPLPCASALCPPSPLCLRIVFPGHYLAYREPLSSHAPDSWRALGDTTACLRYEDKDSGDAPIALNPHQCHTACPQPCIPDSALLTAKWLSMSPVAASPEECRPAH